MQQSLGGQQFGGSTKNPWHRGVEAKAMSAAGLGYVTRLSAARRVDSRQVAFGGVESGNAGLAESELVRTRLERALGLCRIFLANLSQD